MKNKKAGFQFKIYSVFLLISFLSANTKGQIGIGTNSPDPSAILQIQDTTKGLLVPKMTQSQKNAISNPAEGLLIYQTDNDKGFWYFSNTQWKNLTSSNNGGKHTILLADDITNSEAIEKIAREAGPNTQEVRIIRCSNLTSVDLSMLTSLTEVYISADTVLQSINFENLQSIDAGFFIDDCPLLTSVVTSNVKKIGLNTTGDYSLKITNTGITSLSFPMLRRITGKITINNNNALTSVSCPQMTEQIYATSPSSISFPFNIQFNNSLATASFPLLEKAGDFSLFNNPNLTSVNFNSLTTVSSFSFSGTNLIGSVSFPALSTAGYFSVNNNNGITTLNFPSLIKATGISVQANSSLSSFSLPNISTTEQINIANNPSLASVSLPGLTSLTGYGNSMQISANANLTSVNFDNLTILRNDFFYVKGGKLPSSQINYLLNKLVSINPPIAYKVIDLRQSVAAPPTGQGLTDKANLVAQQNTVDTD